MFKVLLILIISFSATAITPKAGLWNVDMKIKKDGKYIDPMAEVKKAVAAMPEAQQKQILAMMAKQGASFGMSDGMLKACYTEKMVKEFQLMTVGNHQKCKVKKLSETAKVVKTKFTCEDGVSGLATWKFKTNKSYTGDLSVNSKKDGVMNMKYEMTFVAKDCGSVKPTI